MIDKSGEKKTRQVLSIETKQEIIEKYEKGIRLVDLAKQYGRNPSTIGTILKQKEAIKATTPSKGLSIMSKRRSSVHDEMERLLLLWIKGKEIDGDSVMHLHLLQVLNIIYIVYKYFVRVLGGLERIRVFIG